jgi:drug/metabolite transporter (DMT)-like permease
MNAHAQLLWQSVTAPRAAVDLARQHPDSNRLGWSYVGISSAWSFVCDLISRAMFPRASETEETAAFSFFDSPVGMGVLTAIFYAMSYVFLRGFWRRATDPAVSQSTIDAAIAVSFACSTALLLPQYLILEGFSNSPTSVQVLGWLVPVLISVAITTVSFSYAAQIGLGRAFGLNIASVIILTLAFALVVLAAFVLWMWITGVSLEEALGPDTVAQ